MEVVIPDNVVGFLQEFCQKNNLGCPTYDDVAAEGSDHCKTFTVKCNFDKNSILGTGSTKKAAKKEAAKKMAEFLNANGVFSPKPKPVVNSIPVGVGVPIVVENNGNDETDDINTLENPIGKLQEYCMKKGLRAPIYAEVSSSSGFTISCSLENITKCGTGKQKKSAKTAAAAAVLKTLALDVLQPSITPKNTSISVAVENENADKNPDPVIKEEQKGDAEKQNDDEKEKENPEMERFRKLYHQMSFKDPEKWLNMYCENKNIDSINITVENGENHLKKVCVIDIPTQSLNLQCEGETEQMARKECCRIAGFILLMNGLKDFTGVIQKLKNRSGCRKPKRSDKSKEFTPFTNLENWLNLACAASHVGFPTYKYTLVDGFYHAECRLLMHTTTGKGHSQKVSCQVSRVEMQNFLLKSAGVEDTDDDLVKSRKIVDLLERVDNEIRLERKMNLDDVVEVYRQLIAKPEQPASAAVQTANKKFFDMQGSAVTKILNLNELQLKTEGLKILKELDAEQHLSLQVATIDMFKIFKGIDRKHYYRDQFVSIIALKKDTNRLVFMGIGPNPSESIIKATNTSLIQMKMLLYKASSDIHNYIQFDSLLNLLVSVEGDLPELFDTLRI